jgi:phosphoribosylformylglycinamidine synthase
MLGRTREELGGSEYLKTVQGLTRGTPPWIDLKIEQAVQACCLEAIDRQLLSSAHDVSDGGLAVTLAECCIGHPDKPLGVRIETHEMIRGDASLFSESQSRIVVSLKEENLDRLKEIAARHNAPMQVIGAVGGTRLTIQPLVQLPVDELKTIWANALAARLK